MTSTAEEQSQAADVARALDRVADALELLATAYVQKHELDRGQLVDVCEALQFRGFFKERAEPMP